MSERLGIYARERATAGNPTAASRPWKVERTRVAGTVIDSDRARQAGETHRSVGSNADVRDALPPKLFNGEA
jgi:hypothetical protein